EIYTWLVIATGTYTLLFTLANIIYLKMVSLKPSGNNGPMVSVLIPARNEAERIAPTLKGLTEQNYLNFEVIVLDDNSEDETLNLVRNLTEEDNRFRVIKGDKLPSGWNGKPFAMQQLTKAAKGEILLFLDADMRPGKQLISWTVTNFNTHQVDFLSGYARHTSPEKMEYLLFPVMYLATSFLLPLWLFRHSKTYMFSHAIGQYFCIRSRVLEETGGFEPVKDKINEDIQMARYLKNAGYSQVFLDVKDYLSGNMYDSMNHAKMGIMRVVYEYFDHQVYPFLFMGFVMLMFLLLPIPAALIALLTGNHLTGRIGLGVLLVLMAWGATMADRKLPWYTAFLYPVHFTWVLLLSIHSIILSKKGQGYIWKGRTVR
ncbi:MAG: glycosyltransferase, partial [Spirochaetaceae bacterium]|nr:glycosyltransferase [Spirochaetaceae bacterium]